MHYDNVDVTIYYTPDLTLKLADQFDNKFAARKLFEYYCKLPKFSRSDTIYNIYGNLDDYLKVLIKFNSKELIQKLKQDFSDWSKIAQNSPPKRYQSIEEMQKMTFEESMKFKISDLTVDCNYILLQIAGALNYLKIKGFDNSLIEALKLSQTYPFASDYSFPKPNTTASNKNHIKSKVISNSLNITDLTKDYQKLETLILKYFENCCGSKMYELIINGSKAYVTMDRNNGYDYYLVTLEPKNKIKIDLISFIIE
jgi:hypothetical protein